MDGWLKDWQYGQMVDALRILFGQIVKSPWASEFPWGEWKEPHWRIKATGKSRRGFIFVNPVDWVSMD